MNMSRADCGFELYGRRELVEAAPHLLGYQPKNSLIAFALTAGDNVVRSATCVDLVDAGAPELLPLLIRRAREAEAEMLAVLVYAPKDAEPPPTWEAEIGLLPHDELIEELAAVAIGSGINMLGGLYICGDRWWVYMPCGDPECCPATGVPIASASRAVTAATYAGLDVLPDRAALSAGFDPVEGAEAEQMRQAIAAAEHEMVDAATVKDMGRWRAGMLIQLRAVLDRASGPETPWLADRVAARLILGLTDLAVRDEAWLWVEGDIADRWIAADRLWRQLARRAPEEYRAAPLFLSAWACWRGGDGPRARMGMQRALAVDPAYTAALLLEDAIYKWGDSRVLEPLISKRQAERTSGSTPPKLAPPPRPRPPAKQPRVRIPQRVRRR